DAVKARAAAGSAQDQQLLDAQVAAQRAIDEAKLQQQITDDQNAADAATKRDKDNLEKRLAALRKEIKAHPERAKQIRVEIDNLLKQYGITPGAVTQASDFNASASLFTAGMGDLKKSMDALTAATNKLAEIESASKPKPPAGEGKGKGGTGYAAGVIAPVPGGVYRVAEAGHPEAIIPLDPSRRTRARSLMSHVARIVGFADGGIPSFGNGALPPPAGGPTNPTTGTPDTPAWRAAAMYVNDDGTDKNNLAVLSALVGSLGPRAQAQAAMRATTISTGMHLRQGQWRASGSLIAKMIPLWQAQYPGIVFETGTPGQQISWMQAASRLPQMGQELGSLIRASMGLTGKSSLVEKATSHAVHFASGYITDALAALNPDP